MKGVTAASAAVQILSAVTSVLIGFRLHKLSQSQMLGIGRSPKLLVFDILYVINSESL